MAKKAAEEKAKKSTVKKSVKKTSNKTGIKTGTKVKKSVKNAKSTKTSKAEKAPIKKKKSILKKRDATSGKVTVKSLAKASADYNPRVITDRELRGLQSSYETYGDLSGIVLNRATNTLVSGHQRVKTIRDKKTRVVTKKHKDSYGTVAIGHVEITEKDGNVWNLPYREVNWADVKAEAAANIAANAGGGQFDKDKLGQLLEELDTKDEFLVETIGLDPLTIRQLTTGAASSSGSGSKSGSGSAPAGFDEFTEDDFELEHTCPKCSFKW
jgi:hypothetical protein